MSAQTSQGVAARTVAMEAAPDRKKPGLLDRIADHFRRYWQLWILTAPALFFVGLFAYVPMWGIQLAFREFDPTKGLTGGKFVGFKYFNEFFHNPLFGEIMTNTIRISLWTLVMGFIFPIILALLINQIGSKKIKGFVQTVTYMPHFISVVYWVSCIGWSVTLRRTRILTIGLPFSSVVACLLPQAANVVTIVATAAIDANRRTLLRAMIRLLLP
jgi:putative aldouronate transport system permease protein